MYSVSRQPQQTKRKCSSVSREADMKPIKSNHDTELNKLAVDQPVPFP